ncbi:pirin family protein [Maribacter sp. 2307ULW6-5]|uniref:pirin family protein n=1 Tax=Maribacter sp. 2307ULW6-5 TaxID=3386275 RepID=UPI0039BD357A
MKSLLRASASHKIHKGDFNIDINFPGLALTNSADKRGLAQLGRFDRGRLKPGVFVAMHPHVNDEILSYIRKGDLVHEDTEGDKTTVTNTKIMMMNAGAGIYHQESIGDNGQDVDMLQIFMRPAVSGLKPRVQFYDFENAYSINEWRTIAGPSHQNVPLEINSELSVYDARLQNQSLALLNQIEKTYVLYVFEGKVNVEGIALLTGDLMVYQDENMRISANGTADMVLFELDLKATYTREGMYSGV